MRVQEPRRGGGLASKWARVASIAAMVVLAPSAFALTQIDFISDAGDYIGSGQTFSLTPADGTITTTSLSGGVAIQFSATTPVPPKTFWSLHLVPIAGAQLAPGRYPSAQRWPFQSPKRPGLDISGDFRGCNTLTGIFTVFEAVFDMGGNIVTFAADAEQHCEGDSAALRTRIRIDSAIPLLEPSPQAIAGLPQEVYEHTLVTLDASQSYEPSGTIVAWAWSQVAGPPVLLESPTSAVTRFRAPEVAAGGSNVRLQLDVQDGKGIHATDTIDVHVFDRHDRRTWLTWRSPPGDYIGNGLPLAFSLGDGDATMTPTAGTPGVEVYFQGGTFNSWTLDFAAPAGGALVPGTYINAERFPFQSAGHPGLSVDGSGRGCNTLTGQFTVLESDAVAVPPQFAARFVQSCEGFMPALRGTILFNGIAPGNPSAGIAGPSFAPPGAAVHLDGSASASTGSALVSYHWRQLSGATVASSDPTQPTLDFVMPTVSIPPIRFELEVADEDGLVDVAETVIAIAAATSTPVPTLNGYVLVLLSGAIVALALAVKRQTRPKAMF